MGSRFIFRHRIRLLRVVGVFLFYFPEDLRQTRRETTWKSGRCLNRETQKEEKNRRRNEGEMKVGGSVYKE